MESSGEQVGAPRPLDRQLARDLRIHRPHYRQQAFPPVYSSLCSWIWRLLRQISDKAAKVLMFCGDAWAMAVHSMDARSIDGLDTTDS